MSALLVVGTVRGAVADYVSALFTVYIILILVYILLSLLLAFGLRPPYSRWFDACMAFLREVTEPYLRVFRRFIPAIGMFDLSPMIALIVLFVAASLLVGAIRG